MLKEEVGIRVEVEAGLLQAVLASMGRVALHKPLEQMERRRRLGLLEGGLQRRRPALRREEAMRLLVRELVLATCSARSASLGRGGSRARAGVRGVVQACVGLYSTLGGGQGPWNRRLEGRPTLGLAAAHWRRRPPPPSPPSSLPLHTPTHAHGAPSCPGPRCASWGGTRTEVGHCQGGAFTVLRRQGSLHRCWRSQSRWRRQVHRPRARAARSRDQGAP